MAFYFQVIHLGILLFLPFTYGDIEENFLRYTLPDWESAINETSTIRSFGNTNQSLSCEDDLHGNGSFNTICVLDASVALYVDSFIVGEGSLDILPNVSLSCAILGCVLEINISGDVHLANGASITAGTVIINAANLWLKEGSSLNGTGLGGTPPAQTTGTPLGLDGAGGGHGGRGAFCVTDGSSDDDTWGGDVYAWSTLADPWSYGSRGGTTSEAKQLGGGGGGRILVVVNEVFELNGLVVADGGETGTNGGGGSGGSVMVQAPGLRGTGVISASGGTGWAGGGGGRVAIESLRQEGVTIFVHGGKSLGCPKNAGAAGTRFDRIPQSLVVSNNNLSTKADTLLYEFPTYPLWTNVYIESEAKVLVPLHWTRMQVRGQFSLKYQGCLSFGLANYPFSEFDLVADEVVMTDSIIKVYGALRLAVKELLMRTSLLQINGESDIMVSSSSIDVSNYVLLSDESTIISNSNLLVHGLGLFTMNGVGDTLKAQRLSLSLFYSVDVGQGAIVKAPLDDLTSDAEAPILYCDNPTCPDEIIHPPDDCNLNASLPFTLQICRVEDVVIGGVVEGSVIHIHRARTVTVNSGGRITSSGLGCKAGMGKGDISKTGAGGGGGHGGRGGNGFFNGSWAEGGKEYGSDGLPCELGSGGGDGNSTQDSTRGGGVIVIGSFEHPLSNLDIDGMLEVDGQSYESADGTSSRIGGIGGGSGGSLLFFLQTLNLRNNSVLSVVGGDGSPIGGGGGGGGRIHFHWSNIATGNDFTPIAFVKGSILTSGGTGSDSGIGGSNGTLSGRDCPQGLYGLYCEECPIGTYKDEIGSSFSLCKSCVLEKLPYRANYIYVRGGASEPSCPYKCLSDKYRMPHCYTPLEELIHTFGGPWPFGLLLSGLLLVLALALSAARMKLVGADEFSRPIPKPNGANLDRSLPFLESLNEVMEITRVEETQTHVHRMYFMGRNSFSDPWKLPHSPPEQITEIIYEDAFNRFVDEINIIAAFQWWEGSIHGILSVLAYPIAWSWQQLRREKKVHRLREYVRSEYNHACLRSCRSRALYEGMKVAATPDLMLAYIDFFLGGDEKKPNLPSPLLLRMPLSIVFGGDGSYMSPYSLHGDNVLTSIVGQAVPATMWYRMVAGLNAQLRTAHRGNLRKGLIPVLEWLNTHVNPRLWHQGVHADLACFQSSSSGYFQLGIVIKSANEASQQLAVLNLPSSSRSQEMEIAIPTYQISDSHPLLEHTSQQSVPVSIYPKRIGGWIIDTTNITSLVDNKNIFYPFSLILRNVHPIGHKDLIGLVISVLLLADISLTLLVLLQFYSISLCAFLVVLLVLPLASVLPFPAGINALFSHRPRKSASLARTYALWNATSFFNAILALSYGFFHYKLYSTSGGFGRIPGFNFNTDESGWCLFELALLLCKFVQARMINWHIANLDIQDLTLYSKDPEGFWEL